MRVNGDDTPPFVKIGNREIYDKLTSLENGFLGVRADLTNILSENTDLRKRVRSLELKFYSILAGMVTGIVVIASIVAKGGHL